MIPFRVIVPPPTFNLLKKAPQKKRKQTSYEKQMAQQAKAYQASVAAFSLGIYEEKKKLPTRITGLEIRPIEKTAYAKQLNKIFA